MSERSDISAAKCKDTLQHIPSCAPTTAENNRYGQFMAESIASLAGIVTIKRGGPSEKMRIAWHKTHNDNNCRNVFNTMRNINN